MQSRSSTKNVLALKQVGSGSESEWWITDDGEEYGPYSTKKEANEDMQGLKRFYRFEGKKGYVTTDY